VNADQLQWFYHAYDAQGGHVCGPLQLGEMRKVYRKGDLKDDDLVWHTDNKEPMVALKDSILFEYVKGGQTAKGITLARPREPANKNLDTSLMYISICGLLLGFIINVLSLVGLPGALRDINWSAVAGVLAIGSFIPLGRTVGIVFTRVTDIQKTQYGFWKDPVDYTEVMFRGCPKWMFRLTAVLFLYTFITFVVVAFTDSVSIQGSSGREELRIASTPRMVRVFSSALMMLYCFAMAILYSASKKGDV
jgi:hypothetical protein